MTEKTIIILEDDIELRERYSLTLEAEGYNVVGAGDSEHILQLIEQYNPLLIITDLLMPVHSGRAGILKVVSRTRVPIIAISAFMDLIHSVKYMIASSLVKPVSDDMLVTAVRDILHTGLTNKFSEAMQNNNNSLH